MPELEHGWPITCSDCGASREGLAEDAPCPSCGSTAITVHVTFHDVGGAVDKSNGITASYDRQQPWPEKWKEIEAAYRALTEVYGRATTGGDPEAWRSTALSFFRACHELPEAIGADSSVPETIKRRARRVAERRAVLRLVADVDNTRKHGGRDPDKCYAHVTDVSWGASTTTKMTIVRECPNRAPEHFDVLDRATAAREEWRRFFSLHGLVP